MANGLVISGALVTVSLGGAYTAAVSVLSKGLLRKLLLAVGVLGFAFATYALIWIAAADGAATDGQIDRHRITGVTKRDPNLTRGTYSLSVRRGNLIARWHGTVRHTTYLDFLIYASAKTGRLLPGFHGEPPQQSLRAVAHRGRDRTVSVTFRHPKALRGWPCAQGNVIDEPIGATRVHPIGPMAFRLLCPRGGFA